MAAGYVVGYLCVLSLVPFLINSIPPTAGWKVQLFGSAAMLCVLLGMRLHYRALIRSVLSKQRAAAVLKRLDYGTLLILVGILLVGRLLKTHEGGEAWTLLIGLSAGVIGGGLVFVQRAQHVWFASSFLSVMDDELMEPELVRAAEAIKRRGSMMHGHEADVLANDHAAAAGPQGRMPVGTDPSQRERS